MAFGVYVHYPFCARRCPYCDFPIVRGAPPEQAPFVESALAELAVRAPDFEGLGLVGSLYLGGGTPGLLEPALVGRLVDAVQGRLGFGEKPEITVECNPEDVTAAKLDALKLAGVNRISLGVQSLSDRWLKVLGRRHDAETTRRAIGWVGERFANFSVDLIHGMTGQTVEQAVLDIEAACALGPPHISVYQLTIESETPFGHRAAQGEALLCDEDDLLALFEAVRAALSRAGRRPYEVSNAAVPGFEAVHNRLYWTGGACLALGPGAFGYHPPDGAQWAWRYANELSPERWRAGIAERMPKESLREVIDPPTLRIERVLTGLRLDEGILVDDALERAFGENARRLVSEGLLVDRADRFQVTDRGRALLNRVVELLTDV